MNEPGKPEVGIVKVGRIKRLFKPTKKQLLISILLLTVVAVVSFLLILNQRELSVEESDRQYAEGRLNQTKKYPPSSDASIEDKMRYYAEVINGAYGSGDYAQVVTEYDELHKLAAGRPLGYGTYLLAADACAKIGNKKKGLDILNEAEQVLKKATVNEENVDVVNDLQTDIDKLRQELSR